MPGERGRALTTRPLDVVLHTGMGKTGTSSVQFFLRDHRAALAEQGVLFPRSVGGARHGQLSLYAKSPEEMERSPEWFRRREDDPRQFRRGVRRRLTAELEESGLSRVLLTDEVLFNATPASLGRLRRLLGPSVEHLREVVYLRRQDDHLVSRYQQGVKTGRVLRIGDWAREDPVERYDYEARLRAHRETLAPDRVVVRRFEPHRFTDGSLVTDFLDACGIDLPGPHVAPAGDRNLSLDAETVEFLRLVNLHRVATEAAVPGVMDNRALVARLAEASSGPVLTLPAAVLDAFMARWEEPNRRVAEEHFGEPELFTTPRKTAGTTTEQRLDPARLDHFLTVGEVPESWHEPLRVLAEREASTA